MSEDTPVLIALVIGAFIGERVMRKSAPPPLNQGWRALAITWGIAALMAVVYFLLIKPRLYQ